MDLKETYPLPGEAYKNLDLVFSREPVLCPRGPIRIADATGAVYPHFGLEIDQFVVAIPDGGPLDSIDHPVVRKDGQHAGTHRVGENLAGFYGAVEGIQASVGEFQRAEGYPFKGVEVSLELSLDSQGDIGCGGDGGGVGLLRGGRDGRCLGDRGGEGNGR